jgi:hypothetical protein
MNNASDTVIQTKPNSVFSVWTYGSNVVGGKRKSTKNRRSSYKNAKKRSVTYSRSRKPGKGRRTRRV